MKNDEEIFDEIISEVIHMTDKDLENLAKEADIFLNKQKEIYNDKNECMGYDKYYFAKT